MTSAHDRLIAALQAHGSRGRGRDWTCPAHDDHRASLRVTRAADRVLVHCFAGCSTEEVAAALAMTTSDLFDEPRERREEIVSTFDYVDEAGELIFQVVRFYPKDFRQRRPAGNGGWTWNLNGTRRVLYHLPRVVEAVRDARTVFVVEGERDVHAIEAAGGVATTNPGGAGKWRDEFSGVLAGADVILVADKDEPGRRHARQVLDSLLAHGATVQLVEAAAGKDARDHLAAGHGLEDFVPADAAPTSGTPSTVRAADVVPKKIDWLWFLRVALGMVSVVAGFPGVGKSTFLYYLAARTSREGRAVLIVTAEDHLAAVVRPRLEAAGANLDLVHILTVPLTLPDGIALLERLVRELGVALVVLDPLVAFIGDNVNTHRDHHVRRVLAPLADLAENTMAAVVVVIHTNKGDSADPLIRISGSVGFTGAARSVLVAADDPQDESRKILAVAKSNLAEFPPPLAYRVVGVDLENDITTSKIEWLGEAPEVDVRALLGRFDSDEQAAIDEAIEFLVGSGVREAARPARELEREARALDIGEKTLQRARRRLGIPSWRGGFQSPFMWGPRPGSNVDAQPGQPHPVQVVQVGADLRKQAPATSNLDNGDGFGESAPWPPWQAVNDNLTERVLATVRGAGSSRTVDIAAALGVGPFDVLARLHDLKAEGVIICWDDPPRGAIWGAAS